MTPLLEIGRRVLVHAETHPGRCGWVGQILQIMWVVGETENDDRPYFRIAFPDGAVLTYKWDEICVIDDGGKCHEIK